MDCFELNFEGLTYHVSVERVCGEMTNTPMYPQPKPIQDGFGGRTATESLHQAAWVTAQRIAHLPSR